MESDYVEASQSGEVLVVDDSAESLEYLCELLRQQGYVVRAAPGGELALWTAASHPPDLILLDVRMPDMDGFEVCQRLKADPRTATVPVIFLSAQSEIEDKINGFRVGGVDYIGKPFDSEEVLQRVASQVKLAKSLQQEVAAHNMAEAKRHLAASAFEASLSCMFITDSEGIIVAINPAFTKVTGYSSEESIGQNARLLKSDRHPTAFFKEMWQAIKTGGEWTGEIWNRRKDGNVFPTFHTITAVRDEMGIITNYVAVLIDLSESKDAQTLIDFLTHYDALTGLPNRILVHDRFIQMIELISSDEAVAILCINLDRFRHINDFHGYAVGNGVLQQVAGQLAECLPSGDTIFRDSADEFVVVHREEAGVLGVRMIVDDILNKLNTDIFYDDQQIAMTVSLGVAMYPMDGKTFDELAVNASLAMARVKERGGGNCAFFSETIDHGVRVRFEMAQRLRHALERKEFEVFYQPQVDAVSARIVSAEALLRWRSPDHGFVSPAVFIPIAEETGSILEIGAWVLASACQNIAEWYAQGLGYVKVAVNLSARQFMQQDICATVADVLAQSGIPPAFLELEITEGAIIDDVQEAIATMQCLKQLGVAISLDDFGTGYSSLSYLKKFPIDYLKIDQSFVRDLITDTDADAIVLSIISLAHNMRLRVIAEGVETAKQCEFLGAHGCDVLQGYLFSKPVPAEEFRSLLGSQGNTSHQWANEWEKH